MISFEREGVVSIWVFREPEDPADIDKDVLKEFCGVDYYDIDFQEGATSKVLEPVASFLTQLSYADSFIHEALTASERIGVREAYGVIAQFGFAYDPKKVAKAISSDPVFIGYFRWHEG